MEKNKVTGFQEWTTKSINICTGCPNDCKYCFAKSRAYRFKQVPEGQWKNEHIRPHDVKKNHKLYDGRIGFPTSHDITPTNINSYIEVLLKLLVLGNEVLIVSKPNFESIKRVCDEAVQFQDKILFRFSIGAMDDEILRFWDTNAPLYSERKKSLKYAFDNGFQTSVSMEPLLDSANVIKVTTDLAKYVTDSIWIGKMNYTAKLKNRAISEKNHAMVKHVNIIENGQTDEKIWAIHDEFQKRPKLLRKIKWKDSFKKVLGIKGAAMPGMDI